MRRNNIDTPDKTAAYPLWARRPKTLTAEEWRQLWGIPNWHQPADYPFATQALSADQWKWEFVRRDPYYRELWESYEQDKEIRTGADETAYNDLQASMVMSAAEYDLIRLYDPRKDALAVPKEIFIRDFRGHRVRQLYGPGHICPTTGEVLLSLVNSTHYQLFAFDLRLPLQPQIVSFETELKQAQSNMKEANEDFKERDRKPDLRQLLRAIDAHSERVRPVDAGTEIFHVPDRSGAPSRFAAELNKAVRIWAEL